MGSSAGEGSCRQDCSDGALDLLAASACVYCFQPFISALCFQPFVEALLAALLVVPGFISRRQRTYVKGVEKGGKSEKALCCFRSRKIEAQASSLTRAEGIFALGSAELEEKEESFNIDIAWNDVRCAVVTECPECQSEAAASADGTSNRVRSGISEAPEKVQPWKSIIQ